MLVPFGLFHVSIKVVKNCHPKERKGGNHEGVSSPIDGPGLYNCFFMLFLDHTGPSEIQLLR
jgi:hypothetical protein